MSAGMLAQYIVIAVMVLISLAAVFRKLAPRISSRWLASASMRLDRPGRARWLRQLGRRLQPKQATGHCGDGCSTCGTCGNEPPAAVKTAAMPLEFRTRAK